jgi:hypothetical protein
LHDGHKPDITANDPEKALAAAEATFMMLVAFNGSEPVVSFEEFRPLLRQYLSLPKNLKGVRSMLLSHLESTAISAQDEQY